MMLAQWSQLSEPGTIGWIAVVAVVVVVVSNVATICFTIWKTRSQNLAFQAEAMQKGADTLIKLQERRSIYDDIIEEFAGVSIEMRDALERRADGPTIDAIRERQCVCFSRSLTAHLNYSEFVDLFYQSDPDHMESFLRDDLVDAIRSFVKRLGVINSPKMLELIGQDRSPMKVRRTKTKVWQKLVLSLPEERRDEVQQAIWEPLSELLRIGGDYPELRSASNGDH